MLLDLARFLGRFFCGFDCLSFTQHFCLWALSELPSLRTSGLNQISALLRAEIESQIIKQNLPMLREEVSKEEAQNRILAINEPYKLEILESIKDDSITIYHIGDEWWDLCTGPHVDSTGFIDTKAVELESFAGDYWRGDEKKKMLQRIYGTTWDTEEQLKAYFKFKEEAEKHDHRRLGQDLDLFSIQIFVLAVSSVEHVDDLFLQSDQSAANHRQSLLQPVFKGVEAMKELNDGHVLSISAIFEPSSTPEHVSLYIHCTLFGLPKLKQRPKITETVKGKLILGTKILQAGGILRVFRLSFSFRKREKLLKAFQCYLSTTAGPIAGLLFVSNKKVTPVVANESGGLGLAHIKTSKSTTSLTYRTPSTPGARGGLLRTLADWSAGLNLG
ncbi:GEM-like protein 6 [Platanthera zijinensis]|uniref:GEM-like protein 6 n=1 Tax=Platanthera zijinensis TaxID=2320716 RepID=A0AAP0C581_9ASPA